ncbi:MAG: hypothetical protein H0T83_04470 [Chthoniobacterales bacterium]|nr:hypothetical protein [Chthoniobacterales bacterium]
MPRSKIRPRSDFAFRADEFVLVAGEPASFAAEIDSDPRNVDHFWIGIRAGRFGLVRISVNTFSRKQDAAGFDPRMRVGTVCASWAKLPPGDVFPVPGLDYAQLETAKPIVYQPTERPDLENLLAAKCERAVFIEGWGALYLRDQLGIHQVHCRRASSSVPTNHKGRDGALRFYFREDFRTEMLLFKYFGQA